MRQLFWRLNIQQYRNIKYKKNKDRAGEFEAKKGRGPSHDLGIDTDGVGVASASGDAAGTPGTPRYGLRRYSCIMILCLTGFADHQQSLIKSSISPIHPLVPTRVS